MKTVILTFIMLFCLPMAGGAQVIRNGQVLEDLENLDTETNYKIVLISGAVYFGTYQDHDDETIVMRLAGGAIQRFQISQISEMSTNERKWGISRPRFNYKRPEVSYTPVRVPRVVLMVLGYYQHHSQALQRSVPGTYGGIALQWRNEWKAKLVTVNHWELRFAGYINDTYNDYDSYDLNYVPNTNIAEQVNQLSILMGNARTWKRLRGYFATGIGYNYGERAIHSVSEPGKYDAEPIQELSLPIEFGVDVKISRKLSIGSSFGFYHSESFPMSGIEFHAVIGTGWL